MVIFGMKLGRDFKMDGFWVLLIIVALSFFILGGCASVIYSTKNLSPEYIEKIRPKFEPVQFDPMETPIGEVYAEELRKDYEKSGAMLITSGTFALLHRVSLVRMAKYTIELQTYIYENDTTSRLLMHEMKLAADRGVKIRILVDDNGLDSDHSDIMTLDYHPNIEVKVFNPYKYRSRSLRIPQLIFHVARMNYRMHNKLFIVDNAASIIGGRNVASNYFDDNAQVNFSDVDILFIGKMSLDAVKSFNEYWSYHRSIPVSVFPNRDKPEDLYNIDKKITQSLYDEKSQTAKNTVDKYDAIMDTFIKRYNNQEYPIYWGKGALISDSPSKTEGEMEISPIIDVLGYLWTMSQKSIYISAAYFVPGTLGTEDILRAADNGVKIKILTNSLSSTDAKVVYAGWMKYRDELLEHGIDIFEFRNEGYKVKNRVRSGASLHSKVMVFDDKITWIGSFNLDGRSAAINTEVVATFYNADFAVKVKESIEEDMKPDKSWHLSVENGKTVWRTVRNGKPITVKHSPDTSGGMRFLMILMTLLPEKMI